MKVSVTDQQTGAALIMVLGVVAIITILVTQLVDQVSAGIRQSSSLKDMRQAYWYARAGETYALSKLKDLVSKPVLEKTDLVMDFPIDEGLISYRLRPLHSCMNLNSLVNGQKQDKNGNNLNKAWQWFLLQEASLDTTAQEKLMHRVKDWVDSDNLPTMGYGAEAPFYSGQAVAQLPSNRTLISPVSLQQMEIVPDSELSHLMTDLCSRPGDTGLSINPQDLKTGQAGILASVLHGQLDREQARTLIEQRPEDGYETLEKFWQQPQLQGLNISPEMKKSLSLKRYYFELETQVSLSESQFGMSSWLYINSENKTRVLARRYGVMP